MIDRAGRRLPTAQRFGVDGERSRQPWHCARRDKPDQKKKKKKKKKKQEKGWLEDSETLWTCVPVPSSPGSTAVASPCRDGGGESVVGVSVGMSMGMSMGMGVGVGRGRRLRCNLAAVVPPPKVVALPTIPSPIAGHCHRWAACTLLRREPARHRHFVRELER
jgi:hypothetical protein